jgi:hypothetical protein
MVPLYRDRIKRRRIMVHDSAFILAPILQNYPAFHQNGIIETHPQNMYTSTVPWITIA